MSIFNLGCCKPTLPTKSLAYILDWIKTYEPIINKNTTDIAELQAWKEEVSDSYIQAQIDAAIQAYDWSSVPEFDAKMDKCTYAEEENFAYFDENGNAIDSGYKFEDFAIAEHEHEFIKKGNNQVSTASGSGVSLTGENFISFVVLNDNPSNPPVIPSINGANVLNFKRALEDPDEAPTQDSANLVTSGGVYDALDDKSYIVNHNSAGNKSIAIDDDGEISIGANYLNISLDDDTQDIEIYGSNGNNIRRALQDPDTTPTADSDKLITSGAVKTALDNKLCLSDLYKIDIVYDSDTDKFEFSSATAQQIQNWLKNNVHDGDLLNVLISINGMYKIVGSVYMSYEETQSYTWTFTYEFYIGGNIKLTATATVYEDPQTQVETWSWETYLVKSTIF